ncbi:MAG: TlpA disulfide reductase family protein [Bacteroidales bacterium]
MRINYILLFPLLCGMLASCADRKEFTIEGKISDAKDKTVYFEKAGVSRTVVLDSAKLKGNGTFKFEQPAATTPEYFRLRLDNQYINLSVDSTETVRVDANAGEFATGYSVTGSAESEKIKTVTLEAMNLRRRLVELDKQYAARKINAQTFSEEVNAAVAAYKKKVTPFIFENPRAAVAYYTLFQRVNGLLIFDPYLKGDYPAYGAVATSWDTFYKGSERAAQLYDITLNALRLQKQGNAPVADFSNVQEQNQIEIVLPDIKGKQIRLSDMKGKVVLLDFTAYQAEYSGPYNIALAKIYDKFKQKDFVIYQVSLDNDEHFWKTTASNLPWITVRDKEGVYSKYARSYNVTSLPTSYLLDRDGAIVSRGGSVQELESKITKLL